MKTCKLTHMIRLLRRVGNYHHPLGWSLPMINYDTPNGGGGLCACNKVFENPILPFLWLRDPIGGSQNNYMREYRKEQSVWISRAKKLLKNKREI